MITIRQAKIYQNGKPDLLFMGEIHYFRIPKDLWATHIEALIESGCNAIGFYVPWLIHEPIENQYEFHGESEEQYDLISFLTLISTYHLPVFLRPGPFVMAELYLEGVAPYLRQHDEIKPITFHGKKVPNDQLDYLHPYFLQRTMKYYEALFQAIHPFLQSQGGPIFGIQLDNEIGMLAWVSQSPALTPDICEQLVDYLDQTHMVFLPNKHAEGHQRLGYLLRKRYATFVSILKKEVMRLTGLDIMMVNIHGTSGGRGLTFPIGYSQLIDTFEGNIIGTDVYFGDLDLRNAHDMYIINSQLNALKDPNTPASTLEFNAGNSNFGDNIAGHDLPQSMDKKIRLSVIQGHKLLNYYLFSAGMNPKTHPSYDTGNHRIALTGERHGFSAPLGLDGTKTYMYDQIKKTTTLFKSHASIFADSSEKTSFTVGLILDQYMTESMRHGTEIEKIKVNLTRNREGVLWETFLRQSLLLHTQFDTIHLEKTSHIDPKHIPVLAISSATYMSQDVQQKIIQYLEDGGKLIACGDVPTFDLDGKPQTALIDYLNIQAGKNLFDYEHEWFSLSYDLTIDGYHDFRTPYAQVLHHNQPAWFYDLNHQKTSYVSDQVIWITNHYPGHLEITKRIFDHFSVIPTIELDHPGYAYALYTTHPQGNYLHLFNFEGYDQSFDIKHQPISHVKVKALDTVMCPLNLQIEDDLKITSTCELTSFDCNKLIFRTEGFQQTITIETKEIINHHECVPTSTGYQCQVEASPDLYWILERGK